MAIPPSAPTFREPVIYNEGLKKWTFDPHWLDWFLRQTAIIATVVTDHGALTGLADDDHPQYHNDARGDLRYQPLDSDLTAIAALATTAFGRALLELADAAALTAAHTHAQLHDAATVSDSTTVDLTLTGQDITAAVISQMSITADASGVKLSGDAAAPGNDKLYGTDGSGVKGWYSQPSGSGLTHPQVLARGLGA